jgi:hypothetical protein
VGALLLGGGVGLSACDAKGRTALHVALERLAQAAEEEAAEEEAAEAKGGAAEAEEAAEAAEAAADGAQGPPSVVPADAQAAQQAKLQAIVGSELQAMVGWLISNQPWTLTRTLTMTVTLILTPTLTFTFTFTLSHLHPCQVGWLLEQANVDVNARDLHGRTPIYIAAQAG